MTDRGRATVEPNGQVVGVSLSPAMLQALDARIAAMPEPRPSRSDAILRVVEDWLRENGQAAGELRPEELNAENDG